MANTLKKIAVLGAGAIGSSVSADLTKAGLDVTVIDQWPAQVEALKAGGLHIKMPDGELHVPIKALHLCDLASANLEFDIVFLAVKSNDHRWMAEFIKPYLKSDGVLVRPQNGMNDDSIASIVGRERIVGCVVELSGGTIHAGAGQAQHDAARPHGSASASSTAAYTPRMREIDSIMGNVGRCDVTGNIYGAKWTKLIANTMTMGPFGLLGLGNFGRCAPARHVRHLGRSSAGNRSPSANALGYRIEPIFGLRADEFAGSSDENLRDGDEDAARPRQRAAAPRRSTTTSRAAPARWSSSRGVVSRKGRELGIATPANDAVVEIDRQINRHEIAMGRENLDLLKQAMQIKS